MTLRDPDRIAPLLREAVGTAQGQVRGITWQVDADNPAHHELLGEAARDARRRAEAYVGALGLSLGAVELISEAPIASRADAVERHDADGQGDEGVGADRRHVGQRRPDRAHRRGPRALRCALSTRWG